MRNLNVSGSISATVEEDYTNVGLICGALSNGGALFDCTATGTVEVTQGSGSQKVFVGGLAGVSFGGRIEGCAADVTLTTRTNCSVSAGGILGQLDSGTVRSCVFNGIISLEQTGSNLDCVLNAAGSVFTGNNGTCDYCTADGEIEAVSTDGNVNAVGLSHVDHGTNRASITAVTQTGSAFAAGCCYGDNADNLGTVSAQATGEGGQVEAFGLQVVTSGTNDGSVTADAADGSASAYGCDGSYVRNNGAVAARTIQGDCTAYGVYAWRKGHSTNSGSVTAASEAGRASAYGCGSGDFGSENEGNVYAFSFNGGAYAYGISGGTSCRNTGAVTAESKDGFASACGLTSVSYSENLGDVTASSPSDFGNAYCCGLEDCSASVNYGRVSAELASARSEVKADGINRGGRNKNYGPVSAVNTRGRAYTVGVNGNGNSENHGDVYASASSGYDGNGHAFSAIATGVNGSNMMNTGAVTAIGAWAFAYGCRDTRTCVSTGMVTATALNSGYVGSCWQESAIAQNSTSVQISIDDHTVSAADGACYFLVRTPDDKPSSFVVIDKDAPEWGKMRIVGTAILVNEMVCQS